jgi:hypothetical protein
MPDRFHNLIGAERQSIDWIRNWYQSMSAALLVLRASVQSAILTGAAVSPQWDGMTPAEVDAQYDLYRHEIDRLTMLNLVASGEASITDDFFRRIEKKQKDELSKLYRKWYKNLSKKKKEQPSFDEEGILSRIKESGVVDRDVVGRFRECLRVRHWLGHGRRWKKPLEMERFDPDDVDERVDALLQAVIV